MTFNPFKGTIRKVKAGYIASAIISVLYIFNIDFSEDQRKILEQVIQALIVFVPSVISFYTKMTTQDVEKVVLKK